MPFAKTFRNWEEPNNNICEPFSTKEHFIPYFLEDNETLVFYNIL